MPTLDGLGAFSLTVLLLGAAACSSDTISATTTSGSGTTSESGDMSTTVSDTSGSSEETSTSTDTSDTADSSMTASISFYAGPSPDDGWHSECDPFLQDCPEGEKCVPCSSTGGNLDANKCVPVIGDGQPGDPCVYGGTVEASDDCDADSYCWDVMEVDGQQVGVCTPICEGTADDPICPMGTACLIANEGSTTLCLSTCDPLLQDCGPGLGCFWANVSFFCLQTTQDIPLGEPCGFTNDCAAGLVCLGSTVFPDCADASCCGSFCSVMAGAPCPQMGTECSAFFEQGMAPLGYEDVGVCILPGA
jgi:hypothetical protein